MAHQSELISKDILAYLASQDSKELLRLITCGSVDDGKSTLIGRLLYDSKLLFDDQVEQIMADSKKHGTVGGQFDPALVTDGLKAEREQGITIDVANRYFSTAKRKYILADTPGHEQYTRAMATGASNANLAIILLDARKGVLTQSKRHSFIGSLLGIRHLVVAINKMDLVNYSQTRFQEIAKEYSNFAARLGLTDIQFIPISALHGDNVVNPSLEMPWYRGSTLMHFLENVYVGADQNLEDFRLPVQWVNRPDGNYRGFCGTVASGIVRRGDEIMVLPSMKRSQVKRIVTFDGDVDEAFNSQSVTVTLENEIDCSRGNMMVRPGNIPKVGNTFDAMVIWMAEAPMNTESTYVFKHTSHTCHGRFDSIRYKIDVNSLHRSPSINLALNEIGRCAVTLNEPIFFDTYQRNRTTGAFIVIDRISNATVGAGMITAREVAPNVKIDVKPEVKIDDNAPPVAYSQPSSAGNRPNESSHHPVSAIERETRYQQRPVTIWISDAPGSESISVERALFDLGKLVALVAHQKNDEPDHHTELIESSRMAKRFNDAGLLCVVAGPHLSEPDRTTVETLIGTDRVLYIQRSPENSVDHCVDRTLALLRQNKFI